MYNKVYVFLGIVAFLALLAMPYWVNAGDIKYEDIRKELAQPKGDKCVKDTEWMIMYHMKLLNEWREIAVRDGIRKVQTENGVFNVTLTECWKCHDYENFCEKCHEYVSVKPVCWECHYNPGMDIPTINYLK